MRQTVPSNSNLIVPLKPQQCEVIEKNAEGTVLCRIERFSEGAASRLPEKKNAVNSPCLVPKKEEQKQSIYRRAGSLKNVVNYRGLLDPFAIVRYADTI